MVVALRDGADAGHGILADHLQCPQIVLLADSATRDFGDAMFDTSQAAHSCHELVTQVLQLLLRGHYTSTNT